MRDTGLGDAPARAGEPARAVVWAEGVDTAYVRAGQGEPIILVVDDADAAHAREMIAVLAGHFLVIAAAPGHAGAAAPGGAFAFWLQSFLEGLGIESAHVLLHTSVQTTISIGDSNGV